MSVIFLPVNVFPSSTCSDCWLSFESALSSFEDEEVDGGRAEEEEARFLDLASIEFMGFPPIRIGEDELTSLLVSSSDSILMSFAAAFPRSRERG